MINLKGFSKKKILVTGGRGFVGTNLIERLSAVDCRIISVGRSKKSNFHPLPNVSEVYGDLRLKKTWEKVLPADIIFHLAAQNDLDISERDPVGNWKDNVLPLLHLLEISKKDNFSPIVIFAGTDTEVGLVKKLPVDESFIDDPVTIYDLHKLFCEKYLEFYSRSGIARGVTLRFSNIYGPGPKSGPGRGILNSMILAALLGRPLTIYGRGNWLRDYVFIGDVIDALLSAVINIDRVKGQHYVIGTGKGITVASVIKLIAKQTSRITGRKVNVNHASPSRKLMAIEMRNMISNSKLFTKATGWKAKYTLDAGIKKTTDYFSSSRV